MARLAGYSSWSVERLVASAQASEPAECRPGDYTAVVERLGGAGESVMAVSAPVAATPLYYCAGSKGRIRVGDNVFSLAAASGLPWEWNLRAIRCLGWFGHTIGRDTLHPRVFRFPPDTLLRADHHGTTETALGFWEHRSARPAGFADALKALRASTSLAIEGNEVLLSLSAGYDSRVLLALCLAQDVRPRCVTMGSPETTDVGVATTITRQFRLRHERITLQPAEYLRYGLHIACLTSGVKTAANWHTYLYARAAAGSQAEVHLVGSNGEFARSFYLKSAFKARAAARLPSAAIIGYWWAHLERRRWRFLGWPLLTYGGPGGALKLAGNTLNDEHDLASALDRFYATERVRHFIGNGLAMYAAVGRPRAPFLEAAVISHIRRLPRRDRVGAAFHLKCIEATQPALSQIPFNKSADGRSPYVHYNIFAEVQRIPEATDRIMECQRLEALISRRDRELLLAKRCNESFNLLLTLAFASQAVDDAYASQQRIASCRVT